jgi:hypothetical protein
MKRCILLSILFLIVFALKAQEVKYIPVHFLYGSRPAPNYKFIEDPWFGGIKGGHVGIGIDSNRVLNFGHKGAFHIVSNKRNKHGRYFITTNGKFKCIFGGDSTCTKTLTIFIPVSSDQCKKLDSLSQCYCSESPYDYALFGMRCAAASYDLLAQVNIVPRYSHSRTYKKIFYPKLLRKMLIKKAEENGWVMIRHEGSKRRIWESD